LIRHTVPRPGPSPSAAALRRLTSTISGAPMSTYPEPDPGEGRPLHAAGDTGLTAATASATSHGCTATVTRSPTAAAHSGATSRGPLASPPPLGSRYKATAKHGHFGRKPQGDLFTWEKTDKVEALRKAAG
jgi:S-adenosylmethionine synthetase